jgi:hypothetical protein|tara:strand:- start:478 stop:759 length:282 start_codon:yes stop_codon:yes gene_type:complete
MEEKTAEEIAEIFTNASVNVTRINKYANFTEFQDKNPNDNTTETEFKARVKRNSDHLEIIKAYKKVDEKTSIWTTQDFSAIDAAIEKAKTIYS